MNVRFSYVQRVRYGIYFPKLCGSDNFFHLQEIEPTSRYYILYSYWWLILGLTEGHTHLSKTLHLLLCEIHGTRFYLTNLYGHGLLFKPILPPTLRQNNLNLSKRHIVQSVVDPDPHGSAFCIVFAILDPDT
jgi:hypothetical protein